MSNTYEVLKAERPELFENIPHAPIEILFSKEEIEETEKKTGQKTGVIYQDPYIYLVKDAVKRQDGTLGTYFRLFHHGKDGGVVVLPITADGKVVLVRHFRHSSRSFHLELPRGFAEAEYTVEENAAKELKEEINGEAVALMYLGKSFPDSGVMCQSVSIFAAQLSETFQTAVLDDQEAISDIVTYSYEELTQMILDGQIDDGFTLTGLYLAKLRGLV